MARPVFFVSLILLLVAQLGIQAEVTLPAIFGDHMVLQQDIRLPVWGRGDAGEKVTVTVGDHTGSAVTDQNGDWRIDLAPLPANTPPTTMTIKGTNTITFQDVLVGEVWLCSGQSNMEYSLQGNPGEIPKANDSKLRLFLVEKKLSLQPQFQLGGSWKLCTPDSAKDFSAVGYYFGRELRQHINRPVGLIGSYWGGSTAQCWTSLGGLDMDPPFQRYIQVYIDNNDHFLRASDNYDKRLAVWKDAQQKWTAAGNDKKFWAWVKALQATQKAHQPDPPQDFPPQPNAPIVPGGDQKQPANCFNGMIAPLIPYAIRGVAWYQGEYNTDDPMEYYDLLPRLIRDWRIKWGQGDFTFLYVQLPALWLKDWERVTKLDNWCGVRDAQLQTMTVDNVGMAVTLDVGGDLHPPGKLYVGQRLSLLARKMVYGEGNLAAGGPLYHSMEVQGNTIRVHFDPQNNQLAIGSSPMADTAALQPKFKLGGFQIAGADKHWVEADAKIDGTTIVVSSPQVPAPVAVSYGWGAGRYDAECNLYDKNDGLPASPFRSDDWDDVFPPNTRLSPGMVLKNGSVVWTRPW